MEGSENQLEHKKEGVYLTNRFGVTCSFPVFHLESESITTSHDKTWFKLVQYQSVIPSTKIPRSFNEIPTL